VAATSPYTFTNVTANHTISAAFAQKTNTNPNANTTVPALLSDCLFDWAEENYASLFSPAATSQTAGSYYYRYYSATNTYLGISSSDSNFYLFANGQLYNLGLSSTWYQTAACQ
jgi:hypothetical protein